MKDELKNYEIAFLTRTEEEGYKISDTLSRYQAKIIGDEKHISRIRLAYPIKKESYAFFGYLNFSAHPENVQKLKEDLRMDQKILRFLITAYSPTKSTSSTIFKQPAKKIAPIQPEKPIKPIQPVKKTETPSVLSNEALEKKLEEILSK